MAKQRTTEKPTTEVLSDAELELMQAATSASLQYLRQGMRTGRVVPCLKCAELAAAFTGHVTTHVRDAAATTSTSVKQE